MIIDSSKGQSASPGTTNLGIRVTNSSVKFETEYILTLNFNDTSGNTSTVTAIYNQLLPDITDLPSRTGYTFLGYYDSREGGNQIYNQSGKSHSCLEDRKRYNAPCPLASRNFASLV